MAVILDGRKVAKKIKEELKEKVNKLKEKNIYPKLAVIMVGKDKASEIYVKNKSRDCEYVGIEYEEFFLEDSVKMETLINLIDELNKRNDIHAILLQSPIPKHLNIRKAFNKIDYRKDVDGFNPINVGKLLIGEDTFIPCTPLGVIKLLEEYNIQIEGKNAVVIGRSNIVGKPLSQYLLNKDATVTVCHSKTKNLKDITGRADILISAVGKPKAITRDMVKENAIIIDVGINRTPDGKIVGDVDYENLLDKVSYITPVPGGVGQMTRAMLINNIIKAAEENK